MFVLVKCGEDMFLSFLKRMKCISSEKQIALVSFPFHCEKNVPTEPLNGQMYVLVDQIKHFNDLFFS